MRARWPENHERRRVKRPKWAEGRQNAQKHIKFRRKSLRHINTSLGWKSSTRGRLNAFYASFCLIHAGESDKTQRISFMRAHTYRKPAPKSPIVRGAQIPVFLSLYLFLYMSSDRYSDKPNTFLTKGIPAGNYLYAEAKASAYSGLARI